MNIQPIFRNIKICIPVQFRIFLDVSYKNWSCKFISDTSTSSTSSFYSSNRVEFNVRLYDIRLSCEDKLNISARVFNISKCFKTNAAKHIFCDLECRSHNKNRVAFVAEEPIFCNTIYIFSFEFTYRNCHITSFVRTCRTFACTSKVRKIIERSCSRSSCTRTDNFDSIFHWIDIDISTSNDVVVSLIESVSSQETFNTFDTIASSVCFTVFVSSSCADSCIVCRVTCFLSNEQSCCTKTRVSIYIRNKHWVCNSSRFSCCISCTYSIFIFIDVRITCSFCFKHPETKSCTC